MTTRWRQGSKALGNLQDLLIWSHRSKRIATTQVSTNMILHVEIFEPWPALGVCVGDVDALAEVVVVVG